MSSITYKARDPLGNIIQGTLDAESIELASQQLVRDGLSVLQIEAASSLELFQRRITKKELVYITSQLAILVQTGITLSSALNGLLEQERNPTLVRVLRDLKSAVESGEDFSTALKRHPKLFDRTYVSLVKASEATGTLGDMLDRIATYLRKEVEARGKVRSALAYPTIMAVVAMGVTIFLLTFVLPKFEPLFSRRGIKLPKLTIFLMGASNALTQYWILWAIAAVALVVGFFFGKRTEPGRKVWDWVKLHLPVVGTMQRKVVISRSVRTLGTLVHSGVSMLDAVQLTADVAGNYYYERIWLRVLNDVTSGKQIYESLSGDPLVPPMLVQMISSGEETGQLDTVLIRVSDYFDQEVEAALKTATSLIEPILITIMGVIVGAIGLGLMLPIFQLSKPPGT